MTLVYLVLCLAGLTRLTPSDEKVNEIYSTLGDHLDYDLVCRALKETSGDVESAIDFILDPPVPKLTKKLSSNFS